MVELKKQLKTEEDKERREEVGRNEKQRLHTFVTFKTIHGGEKLLVIVLNTLKKC